MIVKFEIIANEIRNVAKIIENPNNVCEIDYALIRLKSIVNQFENIRMVDLDKQEMKVRIK